MSWDESSQEAGGARRNWSGGIASHAELERQQNAMWQAMSAGDRLSLVVELAVEYLRMQGEHEDPIGLCRTVGGLRKREG